MTKQGKKEQTRSKILFHAIEHFATHGYSNASSNQIVKDAGVAKGLLFHYFSNKQTLYMACLQEVLREVQEQLDPFLQQMPRDLFDRLALFLKWKKELYHSSSYLFLFLMRSTQLPLEVQSQADAVLITWRKKNASLLAEYDTSLWEPMVNQNDALEVVVFLFDALDQEWMKNDTRSKEEEEELLQRALRLLSVLKVGFYRKL